MNKHKGNMDAAMKIGLAACEYNYLYIHAAPLYADKYAIIHRLHIG
jgi:hypothetical protein